MSIPEELSGLAAHDPRVLDALRDARVMLEDGSLDEREIELVRIGTLIALGAPAGSYRSHVRRARAAGASAADVWSAVTAVATLVGVPRLVGAVPEITAALAETD